MMGFTCSDHKFAIIRYRSIMIIIVVFKIVYMWRGTPPCRSVSEQFSNFVAIIREKYCLCCAYYYFANYSLAYGWCSAVMRDCNGREAWLAFHHFYGLSMIYDHHLRNNIFYGHSVKNNVCARFSFREIRRRCDILIHSVCSVQ